MSLPNLVAKERFSKEDFLNKKYEIERILRSLSRKSENHIRSKAYHISSVTVKTVQCTFPNLMTFGLRDGEFVE